MTTVFLSGSRRLSRLNEKVRGRVDNIVNQDFHIIIGDANGADKAFQKYLLARGYRNVTVYCSGGVCRNNLGDWPVGHVPVEKGLRGRDFYVIKDKAMAQAADYGLMLWDGRSPGTFGNILEVVEQGGQAVVYLSKDQAFHKVSNLEQALALWVRQKEDDIKKITAKLNLDSRCGNPTQVSFEL